MHAQCVACNIRCIIWADISRYTSLKNVQRAREVCNKYIYTDTNPGSIITPHVQRERGKVIGIGVHICLHVCGPKKKFESYFSD